MKKIDEMKMAIINQIKNMDTETFLELQDTLIDFRAELEPTLDLSFVFTCNQCRKLYGDCKEDDESGEPEECIKRFAEYGQREVKKRSKQVAKCKRNKKRLQ